MLIFLGLLLIALFFGLGFAAKVFFYGIIIGLVLLIAGAFSGNRNL